jgi:hypothetical protein
MKPEVFFDFSLLISQPSFFFKKFSDQLDEGDTERTGSESIKTTSVPEGFI